MKLLSSYADAVELCSLCSVVSFTLGSFEKSLSGLSTRSLLFCQAAG